MKLKGGGVKTNNIEENSISLNAPTFKKTFKFMPSEKFSFDLLNESNFARVGKINTHRGHIDTPAFMPVGTQATIKSVFMDDLIVKSSSEEEHFEHVKIVLDAMKAHGLKLNFEKSLFFLFFSWIYLNCSCTFYRTSSIASLLD